MKDLTDITLVLDRSGSMSSCHKDTIEAYNKFISEQQQLKDECVFSLVQFDHEQQVIYNGTPIQRIPLLNTTTYVPRGSTALLDAMGKTIDTIGQRLANTPESQRPNNVLVVILTDGEENASRQYKLDDVRSKIKHQQDNYNWHFVFLGADQDAIAVASSYGIASTSAIAYAGGVNGPRGPSGPSGTSCSMGAMNAAVKNYRTTKGASKDNFFEGTAHISSGDEVDDQTVKDIDLELVNDKK